MPIIGAPISSKACTTDRSFPTPLNSGCFCRMVSYCWGSGAQAPICGGCQSASSGENARLSTIHGSATRQEFHFQPFLTNFISQPGSTSVFATLSTLRSTSRDFPRFDTWPADLFSRSTSRCSQGIERHDRIVSLPRILDGLG